MRGFSDELPSRFQASEGREAAPDRVRSGGLGNSPTSDLRQKTGRGFDSKMQSVYHSALLATFVFVVKYTALRGRFFAEALIMASVFLLFLFKQLFRVLNSGTVDVVRYGCFTDCRSTQCSNG